MIFFKILPLSYPNPLTDCGLNMCQTVLPVQVVEIKVLTVSEEVPRIQWVSSKLTNFRPPPLFLNLRTFGREWHGDIETWTQLE